MRAAADALRSLLAHQQARRIMCRQTRHARDILVAEACCSYFSYMYKGFLAIVVTSIEDTMRYDVMDDEGE